MAFFYVHLVLLRGQVNGTEDFGLTKLVKKAVYMQYHKHVQTCLPIQTTKVNTYAEFTGPFAHKEDGCTVQ